LASFLIQQNTTLNTNPETVARELKIIFLRPNYSDEPNICLLFKHIFSQKTARNMLKTANPKSRTRNFMSPDPAMSTFFVAKQTAPTTSIWQVRVGNFLEKSSIPMLFI